MDYFLSHLYLQDGRGRPVSVVGGEFFKDGAEGQRGVVEPPGLAVDARRLHLGVAEVVTRVADVGGRRRVRRPSHREPERRPSRVHSPSPTTCTSLWKRAQKVAFLDLKNNENVQKPTHTLETKMTEHSPPRK